MTFTEWLSSQDPNALLPASVVQARYASLPQSSGPEVNKQRTMRKITCPTCGGDIGASAFKRHAKACTRDAKQPFGVPKRKRRTK